MPVLPVLAFALGVALALLAPLALGDVAYHRARFTIWATLALATPPLALFILRAGRQPLGAAWRGWWSLALAAYGLHLVYGFGVMLGGSLDAAVALQGTVVVASNFLLAALWGASVALAWAGRKALWLHLAAALSLTISALTSTLLFGRSPSPWIGAALGLVLLAALLARAVLHWRASSPSYTEDLMTQTPLADPKAPVITIRMLLRQFWLDIFGKEVQSAATYSYLWMADQMGHIALGLILDFALTLVAGRLVGRFGGSEWIGDLAGFLVGAVVVSYWEYRAYTSSVQDSTGRFPVDKGTLRRNAIIAAVYMVIGLAVGYAFHPGTPQPVAITIALTVLSILLAPPWLRQKIIWQKASLPYLFRLADAPLTISPADAKELQALINEDVPPAEMPRQVVIAGPIGSGRTSLATGIGSEFAFKKKAVRYLSFDKLLEFAVATDKTSPSWRYSDDPGPRNIGYWPWFEAQVLIIDDIGPVIGSQHGLSPVQAFKALLNRELKNVQAEIGRRHTVWMLGDLSGTRGSMMAAGTTLSEFAVAIAEFCQNRQAPLIIRLSPAHSA